MPYNNGKDSERRAQSQIKTKFSSLSYAEPQPTLSQNSEWKSKVQERYNVAYREQKVRHVPCDSSISFS